MSFRGINLTITYDRRESSVSRLHRALLQCLTGFFHPHSASYVASRFDLGSGCDRSPHIEVVGVLENWTHQGLTLEDLDVPWFPLTTEEVLNTAQLLTTTDNGPCDEVLETWMLRSANGGTADIVVFGNSVISIEYAHCLSEATFFRQLVPLGKCLTSTTMRPGAAVRVDDCYYQPLAPLLLVWSFADDIQLCIRSYSQLWLETAGNLHARTAKVNTNRLAERLQAFVRMTLDLTEDVALDAPKGREWISEFDRIWEGFSIVPGIHLQ